MLLYTDTHFHQQMAKVFHSRSLCQAGEWSEWRLPAVPRLRRGRGRKGFWVRLLTEEDERVGQADSDPPSVAAAGSQWRGGQPHIDQTATRGEGFPSWDIMLTGILSKIVLLYWLYDFWFHGAGVPGQEVCCSAEKGSVCASQGGPIRNSHQPLPCQREPVQ